MATARLRQGCEDRRDEGKWSLGRLARHSAASSSDDLGSVVVTHPFHPLRGRRLAVLFVKRRAGDTVLVGVPFGDAPGAQDAGSAHVFRGEVPVELQSFSVE